MVTDLEEGPGSWMGPKSSRKTKDQRSLMETRSCVEPKSASKTKLTPLMGAEVVGSPMNSRSPRDSRSPLGAEMGSDDSWTPERASSIEEERLNQMACQTRITSIQSDFQWVLRWTYIITYLLQLCCEVDFLSNKTENNVHSYMMMSFFNGWNWNLSFFTSKRHKLWQNWFHNKLNLQKKSDSLNGAEAQY